MPHLMLPKEHKALELLLATDADAGDIVSLYLKGADAGSFDLGLDWHTNI